jgi:hypothetical protein
MEGRLFITHARKTLLYKLRTALQQGFSYKQIPRLLILSFVSRLLRTSQATGLMTCLTCHKLFQVLWQSCYIHVCLKQIVDKTWIYYACIVFAMRIISIQLSQTLRYGFYTWIIGGRTFCRKTLCRTDNLSKIEISSEL